jgi:hypothetical protein
LVTAEWVGAGGTIHSHLITKFHVGLFPDTEHGPTNEVDPAQQVDSSKNGLVAPENTGQPSQSGEQCTKHHRRGQMFHPFIFAEMPTSGKSFQPRTQFVRQK